MKPPMIRLIHGDCLIESDSIESGSVDLILTDPPYGTTACKWDVIIPFDPMWKQLDRIIKPSGAIVLFGAEPFSSALRMSNIEDYKYDWIWNKDKSTNHLNAKKMPLRRCENISVFYKKQCRYNPQLSRKATENIRPPTTKRNNSAVYGDMAKESKRVIPNNMSYPHEVLKFNKCSKNLHPTQKPVDLMEYLIRTYTVKGETVLDFSMGSGTIGVACRNTGRDFIGIELDREFFEVAEHRIYNTKPTDKSIPGQPDQMGLFE